MQEQETCAGTQVNHVWNAEHTQVKQTGGQTCLVRTQQPSKLFLLCPPLACIHSAPGPTGPSLNITLVALCL